MKKSQGGYKCKSTLHKSSHLTPSKYSKTKLFNIIMQVSVCHWSGLLLYKKENTKCGDDTPHFSIFHVGTQGSIDRILPSKHWSNPDLLGFSKVPFRPCSWFSTAKHYFRREMTKQDFFTSIDWHQHKCTITGSQTYTSQCTIEIKLSKTSTKQFTFLLRLSQEAVLIGQFPAW